MDRAYSSQYKGVSWTARKQPRPWRAYTKIDGKQWYFGSYATEEEAVEAYRSGCVR
jgi:hypothetical protein